MYNLSKDAILNIRYEKSKQDSPHYGNLLILLFSCKIYRVIEFNTQ